MSMKLFLFAFIVQGCLMSEVISATAPSKSCLMKPLGIAPTSHLFTTLPKPIIIGHRGNPKYYQENTLQGFKSLLRSGAHGFELDVFLTKDNKLVCFHDKNAKRLTGVNKKIADMTSTEIKRLRYKKAIKYGNNTVKYCRQRKLVFLETVLRWAKRTKLFLFIELKPSDPVLANHAAVLKSVKTGQAVARMVKYYGMLHQTILISFDSLKLLSAKKVQPDIATGTINAPAFWNQPSFVYTLYKKQLETLVPGIKECLKGVSTANNGFVSYLFKYGVIEKAIGALGTGADFIQFDNCTYGTSNTMQTLRQNYGAKLKIGAYTIYSLWENEHFYRSFDWKLDRLIREGIDFLITDDVSRLSRKVCQVNSKHCRHHRHNIRDVINEENHIEREEGNS